MFSLIRILSILITAYIANYCSYDNFARLTTSIGIAHYIQALISSKDLYHKSFFDVYKNSTSRGLVMSLIFVISIFLGYFSIPSIILIFGLHYLLTEIYLFKTLPDRNLFEKTFYLRVVLNTLIYAYLSYTPRMVNMTWVFPIVGVSFLALVFVCWKHSQSKHVFFDMIFFEFIGMLLLLQKNPDPKGHILFVLYHPVAWLFIPFRGGFKKGLSVLPVQLILIPVLYYLTPYMSLNIRSLRSHQQWLAFLAYIHIVTTFFVSDYNPRFFKYVYLGRRAN